MTQLETQPAAEAVDDIRDEALAEHAKLMAQPVRKREAPSVLQLAAVRDKLFAIADDLWNGRVCGKDTCEQVRAKVLAGAENGWPPYYSVQHLVVSKDGRIGPDAFSMRAEFLNAGGQIRIEASPEKAILHGWLPGWPEWKQVEWTQQDSDRAQLKDVDTSYKGEKYTTTHGKYPEDMKVARATTRFMRRYAAHLMGPFAYTADELDENPEIAPPAPTPKVDPDAPTAPTRGERQKPAPQGLKERFEALCLSWKALADKWWPDEDAKAQGLRLRAWAASIVKTDEPLGKLESWTAERLAVCETDLEQHADPRPEDGREEPE